MCARSSRRHLQTERKHNMEEEIKVSITMTVFNHEDYIEQAIESVLMQEVDFTFELLIGEDCSTDRSLELIRQYQDYEQIKIFAREHNMNREKIRNALDLKLRTRGKYVITLEGDDYWTDPHKLQKQVDFLDTHPEYIACAHRFQVVDQGGTVYHDEDFECQFFQDNPYNQAIFESGLMLSHLNTLMYRNYFRDPSFDQKVFTDFTAMGGDYLLHAWLVLHGNIYCLPEVMSSYRKVTAATSSSFSASMEKNNRRDVVFQCVVDSERYLNQTYQISFFKRKKGVFASAVFFWYRNRTCKNFQVVTRIIRSSGEPFRYTGWLLYLLSSRFIKNHTGRKSERVKF